MYFIYVDLSIRIRFPIVAEQYLNCLLTKLQDHNPVKNKNYNLINCTLQNISTLSLCIMHCFNQCIYCLNRQRPFGIAQSCKTTTTCRIVSACTIDWDKSISGSLFLESLFYSIARYTIGFNRLEKGVDILFSGKTEIGAGLQIDQSPVR